MEEVTVMRAMPSDLGEILKIKEESHSYFSKSRPDIYKNSEILYTEEFLFSFFEHKNRNADIVKVGGKIVGFAFTEFMSIELPMLTKRKYVYIHDIAVQSGFQGRGIATRLLKHIEKEAEKLGATKLELAVHLFNDKALSVYGKIGFKPRTVRMEKELILLE